MREKRKEFNCTWVKKYNYGEKSKRGGFIFSGGGGEKKLFLKQPSHYRENEEKCIAAEANLTLKIELVNAHDGRRKSGNKFTETTQYSAITL